MPTVEQILEGLSQITNTYTNYAIGWHLLFLILIIALMLNRKPSNRFLSALLSLPLLSVSIFAWLAGNPFNGSVFAVFGLLLLILGLRNNKQSVRASGWLLKFPGILILIYGLSYPHFLESTSIFSYLYAAPTGLIPCPTLSTVIGFAIIFEGFRSRAWSIALLAVGLMYGLIGFFRLQVYLDAGLLIGDAFLIITIFRIKKGQPNI